MPNALNPPPPDSLAVLRIGERKQLNLVNAIHFKVELIGISFLPIHFTNRN
jgi:hypothetical protein